MSKCFITGCAGFIGFHLANRLLLEGLSVVGLDNLNAYYDVSLKVSRLSILKKQGKFSFINASLEDTAVINKTFSENSFDVVVNLAAQAGVRYSMENPHAYIDSNIIGFLNILEACRQNQVEHLIYASSSSVYGANTSIPYSVRHSADHPLSLYAATKKSNELMAHAYSHLYGITVTGLRFFTVYGPWGRPDMAPFLFTKAIFEGKPIKIFNYGNMQRDFTYIDDIIEGIVRLLNKKPGQNDKWDGKNPDPGSSKAPYKIYNIGCNQPVELLEFISVLERIIGKEAAKEFLPMQPGDVPVTFADIEDLARDIGFSPSTSIDKGIERFVVWYKDYYKI